MALIKIEPIVFRSTDYWRPHEYDDVGNAVSFIMGRNRHNWRLLINDRLYDWPYFNDGFISATNANYLRVFKHIKHCIEIDEAFYGSYRYKTD